MSWIPTEAVEGLTKLPFSVGVAHFDDPPPDDLGDHRALIEADRCRFVNHLEAWIDVDDSGTIVDHGCDGGGLIGSTTMRLGAGFTFGGVAFPDLLAEPEVGPELGPVHPDMRGSHRCARAASEFGVRRSFAGAPHRHGPRCSWCCMPTARSSTC